MISRNKADSIFFCLKSEHSFRLRIKTTSFVVCCFTLPGSTLKRQRKSLFLQVVVQHVLKRLLSCADSPAHFNYVSFWGPSTPSRRKAVQSWSTFLCDIQRLQQRQSTIRETNESSRSAPAFISPCVCRLFYHSLRLTSSPESKQPSHTVTQTRTFISFYSCFLSLWPLSHW